MRRQDTLHPGPRRPSLSKSPSAPELPPIERSKRTQTGSGPSGTGSLRASSGSVGSWELPGRQRSSSLPTVSNDNNRLSNARANASYTKKVGGGGGGGAGREGRGRRVSLIAEDPQNEGSSLVAPPCSPRASPLASRRRASEQMSKYLRPFHLNLEKVFVTRSYSLIVNCTVTFHLLNVLVNRDLIIVFQLLRRRLSTRIPGWIV
jgi:hypothetical protein